MLTGHPHPPFKPFEPSPCWRSAGLGGNDKRRVKTKECMPNFGMECDETKKNDDLKDDREEPREAEKMMLHALEH